MPEEIFDIVDEQDRVIGQAPRARVHREGLRHRAIHVLLFNHQGELFLQKRSSTKDCFPGRWDSSASGHLEQGEEYDACAVREVREELGYELLQIPKRCLRLAACEETGQEFVWVYRAEAQGPFALNPDEIETGGWFGPKELNRWMKEKPDDFAPSLRVIWKELSPGLESSLTIWKSPCPWWRSESGKDTCSP